MVAENALEVAAKDGHWVILQVSLLESTRSEIAASGHVLYDCSNPVLV